VTGQIDLAKGKHGMTGDAINSASRLVALAGAGEILVGRETYGQAEGYFIFERLEPIRVKGKQDLLKAYRVIAPSTRRTRLEVSAERGLTPLVGRKREIERLLNGFELCKAGIGQVFSIVSEAGVGKSRLLYEFRKALAKENVTFLEGRCLSYSKGAPYQPIIDILKSNFDIIEGEETLKVREKVKKGLKILDVGESSTLPYLLELLSVENSGIDKISMSPEARKDRIIEALKQISLKGSQIRPLILAIEDIHLIDHGSADALKELIENISAARIFLLFTYRPESFALRAVESYHNRIYLNRFSTKESLDMLSHLLGAENIEADLEKLIMEKTEGVPFFIEEFVKFLKDLKIIVKQKNRYYLAEGIEKIAIPSTIRDTIMARVDSLPEGAKAILQAGAVIEREFSYRLIKRLTGHTEKKILSGLSNLMNSELVYERGVYPNTTFIFKHALTQDVIYDSILLKKKRNLHKRIGQAIEGLNKDNIDEYYSILAEHFIKSENYKKGGEYSRLAGKKAVKTGSIDDAIGYAKKRVACLEKLFQTEDVQIELIDAKTILGLYYIQKSCHVDAKDAVDHIIDLTLKHKYKKRLLQQYTILGTYYNVVEEDILRAFNNLKKALQISEEIGDAVSSIQPTFWLGCAFAFHCDFKNALYHCEKAFKLTRSAGSLWGMSMMKSTIADFVYSWSGRPRLAYQTSAEAIRIGEKSGDIFSKSRAYVAHGFSSYGMGYFEEATEYLLKWGDRCERINYLFGQATAQFCLGETYFEMGNFDQSKHHYNKTIQTIEQSRFLPSWMNLSRIGLERAKVMNGDRDIDLETLYRYVNENKIKFYEGLMARYVSEVLFNIDDQKTHKAKEWIRKAIQADEKNGMMWHLGRDYAFYGGIYTTNGDYVKGKENLAKAIEILKECGADGWVEKYEKKLATL
jgi:tetratricopeptide (TPR) repeat protein